jgi:hypothetical protein
MTRRTAALLALNFPVWLKAAPFWDSKDPKKWTDAERKELLTKSPWARPGSVHYDQGPGGLNRASSAATSSRRGGRGGYGLPAPDGTPTIGATQALVRWESALPVREADGNRSKDDPAANYILSITGDLPMLGEKASPETEAEVAARGEALKQHTKLEKRGGAILLERVAAARDSGTLFYFERNDLIRLSDHEVTFVTKLGPIEVKAKFVLKDMLYRGKLEL